MPDVNPYESSLNDSPRPAETCSQPATRWLTVGFAIGATIPVVFGVYGFYRESVYAASLPPGTAACGTGRVALLALMFVGGPVCGIIGGGMGWVFFKLCR